jgi:hypothetical protein
MPKLKLLILDAGVVIELHELGLWDQVVDKCDIHMSQIVVEQEVQFSPSEDDQYGDEIDLQPFVKDGRVQMFRVTPKEIHDFRCLFDDNYFVDLDDGEAESLTYLFAQKDDFLISSGDAITFRVLGNTGRTDQGISLQEILQKIGLGRELPWAYTKEFREKYSNDGSQDMIQGRGKKS